MSEYIECPTCGFENLPGGDNCESCHCNLETGEVRELLREQIGELEKEIAALKARIPKYEPGDVVWVIDVTGAIRMTKVLYTGYFVSWFTGDLPQKESELHPTPEAAQAALAEIDNMNGEGGT